MKKLHYIEEIDATVAFHLTDKEVFCSLLDEEVKEWPKTEQDWEGIILLGTPTISLQEDSTVEFYFDQYHCGDCNCCGPDYRGKFVDADLYKALRVLELALVRPESLLYGPTD